MAIGAQGGDVAARIEAIIGQSASPEERWRRLVGEVLTPDVPFELHWDAYRRLSTETDGLLPAWWPTEDEANQTNLADLMRLEKWSDYAEFHRRSVNARGTFWRLVQHRLRIPFDREPETWLSDDGRWCPDARLNIAEACFRNPIGQIAVRYQATAGAPIESLTYGDLRKTSRRVVAGLVAMGLKPGDAVAVDMAMIKEAVVIYLGLILGGFVVVGIADSFSAEEIAVRLQISDAKAIFTTDRLLRGGKALPMYAKVVAADAPPAIVLQLTDADDELRDGDHWWHDFLPEQADVETVMCDADDAVNILFSSGTTGAPKAIPWTHLTPIKAAMDAHCHMDVKPGQVVAWPTNLGWMMGPWLIFATMINHGTVALYGDAPNSAGFCRFVQDVGVELLGVVPSLVKAWRQGDMLQGLDWTGIRYYASTGECSNTEDMLWLMSRAGYRPVIEYCGGTEIGGGYLTGSPLQAAAPGAFTTPTLGLEFAVLGEDDAWVRTGEGEVFLVPPSIGLSDRLLNRDHHQVYFEGAPKGPYGEIMRRHGDQIEQRADGFYRALGRVDDTMNLGGVKTSAAELERVLKQVEGVDDVAAIAVSPKGGGPSNLIVFAVSQIHTHSDDLQRLMQTEIKKDLNPLFKIHDVRIVDQLPRTASGKVMRRTLRDQASA